MPRYVAIMPRPVTKCCDLEGAYQTHMDLMGLSVIDPVNHRPMLRIAMGQHLAIIWAL